MAVLALLAAGVASGAAHAAPTPRQVVAQAKAEWLKELLASARTGDRSAVFPSPSRTILMRRLHEAQRLYGFDIAGALMLRPLQRAPVIVIRSDRKQSIARATPKIVRLFDPYRPTAANPSGWAYEGYFLVAETTGGVPYLATFNHWRAPHVGGG